MCFNRFLTWQLAIVGLLLGSGFAHARQGPSAEDLLDPSLDRPIIQYRSTADSGFESLVDPTPPWRTRTSPSSPEPVSLQPSSAAGAELAPNPLADATSPKPLKPAKRLEPTKRAEPVKPLLKGTPFKPTTKSKPKTKPTSKAKAKPAKKATAKKKTPAPRQPVVNYDIYRDSSHFPIDPRKPNNTCTQRGGCQCELCGRSARPGKYGRPYQPQEPGGYQCGKNCPNKRPQFSAYWPRPFSAKLDERHPERAADRYSGACQKPKLNDAFDRLANFRLIDYQRTDNGYCGPGSDPYGCLGESKTAGVAGVGGVSGLGFRVQSEPVAVPAGNYPRW